jgi:hypothetical protein
MKLFIPNTSFGIFVAGMEKQKEFSGREKNAHKKSRNKRKPSKKIKS